MREFRTPGSVRGGARQRASLPRYLLQWTVTAGGAVTYTLQATTNLVTGPWVDVPGQGPRPGAGGDDAMADDGEAPARFYRVRKVGP